MTIDINFLKEVRGWEIIDTFGNGFILARGDQRMVVDEDGKITIIYART